MRIFRVAAVFALFLLGSACSDDSADDDPISEPDVTREVEDPLDE